MNHRNAWALEKKAPSREQYLAEKAEESAANPASASQISNRTPTAVPAKITPSRSEDKNTVMEETSNSDDILVVASKLKSYIRAKSGMNTAASVLDVLSDKLRHWCDDAIDEAQREGRKTVMDRDFK